MFTQNFIVETIWQTSRRDQNEIVGLATKLLGPIKEGTTERWQKDALIVDYQYNLLSAPLKIL